MSLKLPCSCVITDDNCIVPCAKHLPHLVNSTKGERAGEYRFHPDSLARECADEIKRLWGELEARAEKLDAALARETELRALLEQVAAKVFSL